MASHSVKCLLLTSSALQLLPGLVGIRLPPNESSVLPGAFTQMGLLRTLLKGRNSWRNPDQMPRLPQLTPFSKNKKNSFQKTLLTPRSFFFHIAHIFVFNRKGGGCGSRETFSEREPARRLGVKQDRDNERGGTPRGKEVARLFFCAPRARVLFVFLPDKSTEEAGSPRSRRVGEQAAGSRPRSNAAVERSARS